MTTRVGWTVREKKEQSRIVELEKGMSNSDLLENVISQAGGDDNYYDDFTRLKEWEFEYLQICLYQRLLGWLMVE